jgi:hypothetical protein
VHAASTNPAAVAALKSINKEPFLNEYGIVAV